MTLRDALAECLWSRRDALPVADADGAIIGMVTLRRSRAARREAGVKLSLGLIVRLVVLALLVAFLVSPQSFASVFRR